MWFENASINSSSYTIFEEFFLYDIILDKFDTTFLGNPFIHNLGINASLFDI